LLLFGFVFDLLEEAKDGVDGVGCRGRKSSDWEGRGCEMKRKSRERDWYTGHERCEKKTRNRWEGRVEERMTCISVWYQARRIG